MKILENPSSKRLIRKLPISVVMVVYNEENVIEEALKSCVRYVDEIVIVHDGPCQDSTIDICRKYTNKIYIRKHLGNSESHRPFSFKVAKNNWLLRLDADERITEELGNNLSRLISNNKIGIYEMIVPTRYKGRYYDYSIRTLFQKKLVSFIGAVHENVKPLNEEVIISKTKYKIIHEPKEDSLTSSNYSKKIKGWARAQAEIYLSDFAIIPKWNYLASDWGTFTRLRIQHPIILGMMATSIYHYLFGIRLYILNGLKEYYLKQGILSAKYYFYVYYFILLGKINEK